MAKLRRFTAYRRLERPYTRISKYTKKNYVKYNPGSKISRFETGNMQKSFEAAFDLVSKSAIQIRQEALESARMSSNRLLEKRLGKGGFRLKLRVYPFHVLRENPLASGAGADRMSTGMKQSFGKTIGCAAQVKKGQVVITAFADKNNSAVARLALERASKKLPCGFTIQMRDLKKVNADNSKQPATIKAAETTVEEATAESA